MRLHYDAALAIQTRWRQLEPRVILEKRREGKEYKDGASMGLFKLQAIAKRWVQKRRERSKQAVLHQKMQTICAVRVQRQYREHVLQMKVCCRCSPCTAVRTTHTAGATHAAHTARGGSAGPL